MNSTLKEFHEAQRGEISRWVRDSEAGWLFYDHRGHAYHLLTNEAEALERGAVQRLERLMKRLEWSVTVRRVCGWGSIVLAASTLPVQGMPYHGQPNLVLLSLAAGMALVFFANLTITPCYFLNEWRWRNRTGRRLAVQGRAGVPELIETKHRRHNVFRMVQVAAGTVFLTRFLWRGYSVNMDEMFQWIDLVLIVLFFAAKSRAERIDRVHVRRKWLD